VILMQPDSDLEILAGTLPVYARPSVPFNATACSFLADLSATLLRNTEAKQQADVVAFAFWCRKANIAHLKGRYAGNHYTMGRGTAFHISPGNVPINAFYSFAFGLLAGNNNIVRLASKASLSVNLVLDAVNLLFGKQEYRSTSGANAFVRYDAANGQTDILSARCDARIIWGGDKTIADIRKSPIPPRAHEIVFADRYSFAVFDAAAISTLSDKDLQREAVNFYNDTLQMDQNACSSPHLIVWQNADPDTRQRFWTAVCAYTAQKYALEPVASVDRYARLLSGFITGPKQQLLTGAADPIQRVQLSSLPSDIDQMRGIHGLFYEYDANDLQEVAHIVNMKYQTLTYLGLDKKILAEFVTKNRLRGIDRIVPNGSALDIDTLWDGYDVLKELTRTIDVR